MWGAKKSKWQLSSCTTTNKSKEQEKQGEGEQVVANQREGERQKQEVVVEMTEDRGQAAREVAV